MSSLTEEEKLEQQLLESGRSYGIVLDREFALVLVRACGRRRRRLGYKPARDQVLEDAFYSGGITTDNELEAYKDFIDRRFQYRAREALALKHRPGPPLSAYEDGHH